MAIMQAMRQVVISARRVPVTVVFVVVLAIAELGYTLLTRPDDLRLVAWASTNVARLRTEPIGPMLVSAFVVEEHQLAWLIVGGAAFAIVEWRLGWWRALVAALAAHVLGTLVSEGVVWWRVRDQALPASALHQVDVGVSYIVVGVLAVAAVVAPRVVQIVAVVLLVGLSPALLDGITTLDVDAVGHLTAVVTGVASGLLLRVNTRRSVAFAGAEPA